MIVSRTGAFYKDDISGYTTYTTRRGTYGGCDIVATITVPQLDNGVFVIGELQTITYSIHTEDRPVRAFGFRNVKGFTAGPRTIAGTLIFTVFDRHVFKRIADELRKKYGGGIGNHDLTAAIIADELPPFNVTVTFANETGDASSLVIYGVHIQDEGQVMSIDDIIVENTMSYFAMDIIPMDYIIRKQVKPSDLIGTKIESVTDPFVSIGTVFDYYVYGQIKDSGGLVIPPERFASMTVTALIKDMQPITTDVKEDGYYFIYSKEQPYEVYVTENSVKIGSTTASGHRRDILI